MAKKAKNAAPAKKSADAPSTAASPETHPMVEISAIAYGILKTQGPFERIPAEVWKGVRETGATDSVVASLYAHDVLQPDLMSTTLPPMPTIVAAYGYHFARNAPTYPTPILIAAENDTCVFGVPRRFTGGILALAHAYAICTVFIKGG